MGIKRSVCSYSSRFEMVETSLPRAYNDEHLIKLVLKQCLSDTSLADKQVIRPGLVNRVLAKLIEMNPLYQNIQINLSWENICQVSDPELWDIITDKNHKCVESEIDYIERIFKEMIIFMKKWCKILFCFHQICITLKVHQYPLVKFLIQYQAKTKFLFLSQINLIGKH